MYVCAALLTKYSADIRSRKEFQVNPFHLKKVGFLISFFFDALGHFVIFTKLANSEMGE